MAPAALLILAGPSTAGKDTLLTRLLAARPELGKPVTSTTRSPRDGEVHGVHYHFFRQPEMTAEAARAAFLARVAAGDFIEHAPYGDNLYGCTWTAVGAVHEAGRLPAVILEVQGVASVRQQMPVVTIFVQAPMEQIEARLRATRPADEIPARLETARHEIAQAPQFDCVIDNVDGELETAFATLLSYYDTVAKPRLQAGTALVTARHATVEASATERTTRPVRARR